MRQISANCAAQAFKRLVWVRADELAAFDQVEDPAVIRGETPLDDNRVLGTGLHDDHIARPEAEGLIRYEYAQHIGFNRHGVSLLR
jgi:hypothetical protein